MWFEGDLIVISSMASVSQSWLVPYVCPSDTFELLPTTMSKFTSSSLTHWNLLLGHVLSGRCCSASLLFTVITAWSSLISKDLQGLWGLLLSQDSVIKNENQSRPSDFLKVPSLASTNFMIHSKQKDSVICNPTL